jgi:hypothetical protein
VNLSPGRGSVLNSMHEKGAHIALQYVYSIQPPNIQFFKAGPDFFMLDRNLFIIVYSSPQIGVRFATLCVFPLVSLMYTVYENILEILLTGQVEHLCCNKPG